MFGDRVVGQRTDSHHLPLVRMSDLVDRKHKGKAQIYSLNRGKVEPTKQFPAKLK